MNPDILAAYCQTKLMACRRENGPADLQASVHAKPLDGDGEVIIVMAVDGDPVLHLANALALIVAARGPLEWAGLLCDAHIREEIPGEPVPQRGEFAAEFAARPDTRVREALIFTWRDSAGGSGMDVVTYSYPDGPFPRFDPVVHHRLAGGGTDTALRTVLP